MHDLLEHLRGAAAAAARRAPPRAPAGGSSRSAGVVAVTRAASACARRQREHVLRRSTPSVRAVLALLLRSICASHLARRRQRVGQRVDLVQHDEARRRVAAEVVAPDREVGLGDAGVGAEDEDRGVRRRQQAERQLGLGADRVQARRVEDHQALLEQRVRVVDQRMAPRRHLDLAVGVARRVVFGMRRRPRSRARALRRRVTHSVRVTSASASASCVGVVDVERRGASRRAGCARSSASDSGSQPRLDRQQRAARRLVAAS